MHLQLRIVPASFLAVYLVVDVISAHGDGVHDKLPAVVVCGSADGDVVGVVLCAKIVAQFVSRHQIGLLRAAGQHTHIMNYETLDQYWICENNEHAGEPELRSNGLKV